MGETIRCLSLHQPWASLMAVGEKSIETRSWSTPYRGLVAIHAAKNLDSLDLVDEEPFESALIRRGYPTYKRYGQVFVKKHALEFGAIVAVGLLTHVGKIYRLPDEARIAGKEFTVQSQEEAFGDYTPGRFAWIFHDVVRLAEPIPLRGQQGLWALDREVVERIQEQTMITAR